KTRLSGLPAANAPNRRSFRVREAATPSSVAILKQFVGRLRTRGPVLRHKRPHALALARAPLRGRNIWNGPGVLFRMQHHSRRVALALAVFALLARTLVPEGW